MIAADILSTEDAVQIARWVLDNTPVQADGMAFQRQLCRLLVALHRGESDALQELRELCAAIPEHARLVEIKAWLLATLWTVDRDFEVWYLAHKRAEAGDVSTAVALAERALGLEQPATPTIHDCVLPWAAAAVEVRLGQRLACSVSRDWNVACTLLELGAYRTISEMLVYERAPEIGEAWNALFMLLDCGNTYAAVQLIRLFPKPYQRAQLWSRILDRLRMRRADCVEPLPFPRAPAFDVSLLRTALEEDVATFDNIRLRAVLAHFDDPAGESQHVVTKGELAAVTLMALSDDEALQRFETRYNEITGRSKI